MSPSEIRRRGREQADRMLALVRADLGPDALLFRDPLSALEDDPEVELCRREEDPDPLAVCSIAGHYELAVEGKPARITVMTAASIRRQQFTALHEFGHHLQQNTESLADALFEYSDNQAVEEAACDAFAAEVLLPSSIVDAHVADRGPDSLAVRALYDNSQASRAACAVAASQRLGQPGVVLVLSRAGEIVFASASGDIAPPQRGTDASEWPLFAMARRSRAADTSVSGQARITYGTGSQSQTLYSDVCWCDGHYVAVLTVGGAAWAPFSPPINDRVWTASRWWTCEYCLTDFEAQDRCDSCGQPRCPAGHCQCTANRERTCSRCGLLIHASRFAPGSDECADCNM